MSEQPQKDMTPPAPLPASHRDLVERPTFLSLATVMDDGTPQVTPVWFEYQEPYIFINSAKGRVKDANMRANPSVGGCIIDPENPYRYLGFRGIIVEVTEEGAEAHIHKLSNRYTGHDYRNLKADEQRVIYKIHPNAFVEMG